MRLIVGSGLLLGGATAVWLLVAGKRQPFGHQLVLGATILAIAATVVGGGILTKLGQALTEQNALNRADDPLDPLDPYDPRLWTDQSLPPNSSSA